MLGYELTNIQDEEYLEQIVQAEGSQENICKMNEHRIRFNISLNEFWMSDLGSATLQRAETYSYGLSQICYQWSQQKEDLDEWGKNYTMEKFKKK